MDVTRDQVIAYRVAAQGLHRGGASVAALDVLDIGVQEAMGHPAGLAFAARLPANVDLAPGSIALGPGHRLALAWTLRGAPHVHRRKDLDALAGALWPLSEADARARLNETGPSVRRAGITALDQFTRAVDAMRRVVDDPIRKGAASAAVTALLPESMHRVCRPCKSSHISDSAMRASSLPAGIELEPGSSPPLLSRRPRASVPSEADGGALRALARQYLRLLGPAGPGEFAGYLEARRADVTEHWPDDLVDVSVDGRSVSIPCECVDDLRTSPAPEIVRLLGPFDPYLQARDRSVIVPVKAAQKVLWPVLGRPGALFVDGEIAGVWRTKASGSKLTITVETFAPVRPSAWDEVDAEARRVAEVRGASDVHVLRPSR